VRCPPPNESLQLTKTLHLAREFHEVRFTAELWRQPATGIAAAASRWQKPESTPEDSVVRVLMLSLALTLLLPGVPRYAKAQSPIGAIASLIETLSSDSATGIRRDARDSTLVSLKDEALVPSEARPESLPPLLGVQVRYNAYMACAGTDSPGSRLERARCALQDFDHYIEITDFTPHGDSARAIVTVSWFAQRLRHRRPWYRRVGGTLTRALGRHGPPTPPLWFHTYSATFVRGSDGQWTTATLQSA